MTIKLFIGEVLIAEIMQIGTKYFVTNTSAQAAGSLLIQNTYASLGKATEACKRLVPPPCRAFVKVKYESR